MNTIYRMHSTPCDASPPGREAGIFACAYLGSERTDRKVCVTLAAGNSSRSGVLDKLDQLTVRAFAEEEP